MKLTKRLAKKEKIFVMTLLPFYLGLQNLLTNAQIAQDRQKSIIDG